MKPLMTRWNALPANPKPGSPVASALKLCTVRGTCSPYRPITILPASNPPIVTSKYTFSVTAGASSAACKERAKTATAAAATSAISGALNTAFILGAYIEPVRVLWN